MSLKRVLIHYDESGPRVDYMDEGITVEIRYVMADPPFAREHKSADEDGEAIELELDMEDNYRRKDHARPEFEDYTIPLYNDEEDFDDKEDGRSLFGMSVWWRVWHLLAEYHPADWDGDCRDDDAQGSGGVT